MLESKTRNRIAMMNDIFNTLDNQTTIINQNDENFTIDVSLPGVHKDELNINIEKDVLTLSIKEDESYENKFVDQRLKKRFNLPQKGAQLDRITASLNNGVLHLEIPKEKSYYESKNVDIN